MQSPMINILLLIQLDKSFEPFEPSQQFDPFQKFQVQSMKCCSQFCREDTRKTGWLAPLCCIREGFLMITPRFRLYCSHSCVEIQKQLINLFHEHGERYPYFVQVLKLKAIHELVCDTIKTQVDDKDIDFMYNANHELADISYESLLNMSKQHFNYCIETSHEYPIYYLHAVSEMCFTHTPYSLNTNCSTIEIVKNTFILDTYAEYVLQSSHIYAYRSSDD